MSKRTEALLETIQGTDLWERSELGFQKRSGDKKRTGWEPRGAELKRFRRQFPGTRVSQRTAGYQVRQVEVRMETCPCVWGQSHSRRRWARKARCGGG